MLGPRHLVGRQQLLGENFCLHIEVRRPENRGTLFLRTLEPLYQNTRRYFTEYDNLNLQEYYWRELISEYTNEKPTTVAPRPKALTAFAR